MLSLGLCGGKDPLEPVSDNDAVILESLDVFRLFPDLIYIRLVAQELTNLSVTNVGGFDSDQRSFEQNGHHSSTG